MMHSITNINDLIKPYTLLFVLGPIIFIILRRAVDHINEPNIVPRLSTNSKRLTVFSSLIFLFSLPVAVVWGLAMISGIKEINNYREVIFAFALCFILVYTAYFILISILYAVAYFFAPTYKYVIESKDEEKWYISRKLNKRYFLLESKEGINVKYKKIASDTMDNHIFIEVKDKSRFSQLVHKKK